VPSPACYISDFLPAVLYLPASTQQDSATALQINAEVGGDNVHRVSAGVFVGAEPMRASRDLLRKLTKQAVHPSECHSKRPLPTSLA